jgi:bifunctional NMN adenylyltransferase/nudix hydrolase
VTLSACNWKIMRTTPVRPPSPSPIPARADDVAILIGRFAPCSRSHLDVLRAALSAYRLLIVVIGSAFQAPSPRNPFTWQQRADMIGLCLADDEQTRVRFVPVRDHHSDDRWAAEVGKRVFEQVDGTSQKRLTIVNPEPDEADGIAFEWPRIFPRWGYQPLRLQQHREPLVDAGTIRNVLFSLESEARTAALSFLKYAVPDEVRHYLSAWWELPLRDRLAAETDWLRQYRQRWPAEQAMTVDAVVTCSNHVLLIERGEGAGAGLFALPGGFLEKNERFYEGAKRELREETGLGYIGDGLDVAFARAEVFDRPDRSLRARIVTVAHLFELKVTPLPDVQGRDDARHALWVPTEDLVGMEERFFEDHFQILDHFLGLTRG